jgi:protein-disulfide isomerase
MKQNKEIIPVIPPKDIIVGAAGAPITILMFGDYESEATAKASEVMSDLLSKFEGSIKLNFRHFPLTRIHQKAHKAAEAAIGAGQEGKFWEMHLHLLAHRNSLGMISLKSYAREVGVTDKKFLEHLMNSDYGWFVQDDLKEGLKLGVVDIPAIFINGVRFEKEPTLKNLTTHLNTVIEQSKATKVVRIKERKTA